MPAANLRTARVDHRFAENQSGKRKAVIVIRERNGNTLPAVERRSESVADAADDAAQIHEYGA